jgi:ADP-ribosylglycohydrolase
MAIVSSTSRGQCHYLNREAKILFFDSHSYEDEVRNAVALGEGDTLLLMTGGIAEAFYGGVPDSNSG